MQIKVSERKGTLWRRRGFGPLQTAVYFQCAVFRWKTTHNIHSVEHYEVLGLQFDDVQTTINALSFYSVVAWQLLAITYVFRENQEAPAQAVFEQNEVRLLEKIDKKPIKTVKDAVLALAKIVGFAKSKRQPLPGVKVLAQAFERFDYIKLGNIIDH